MNKREEMIEKTIDTLVKLDKIVKYDKDIENEIILQIQNECGCTRRTAIDYIQISRMKIQNYNSAKDDAEMEKI